MSFTSWFARFWSAASRKMSRRRKQAARVRRLRAESLEGRALLATFLVDLVLDEDDGNYAAGDLSLREAIVQANTSNGADTINFAPTVWGPIVLTQGELIVANGAVTINGPTNAVLVINGGGESRILNIETGGTAVVKDLTFRESSVSDLNGVGGGAVLNNGTLTLERVEVSDSVAAGNGGALLNNGKATIIDSEFIGNFSGSNTIGIGNGNGGAIATTGELSIRGSLFYNNFAGYSGGAIALFGGGTTKIVNSTIYYNSASGIGGGIIAQGGQLYLGNSTLALNAAGDLNAAGGGGLAVYDTITLENSLILGNIRGSFFGTNLPDEISGSRPIAGSWNTLIADPSSAGNVLNEVNGNIVGSANRGIIPYDEVIEISPFTGDPLLTDNGGPTLSIAPLLGGPAINKGGSSAAITAATGGIDQRGAGRVGKYDLGAVELVGPTLNGLPASMNYYPQSTPTAVAPAAVVTATVGLPITALTARISLGAATGDFLSLRTDTTTAAGNVTFNGPDVLYGPTVIGTMTSTTTSFTILFNPAASTAAVQAVIRRITFSNALNAPVTTPRFVELTLSDRFADTVKYITVKLPVGFPRMSGVVNGKFSENGAMFFPAASGSIADTDTPVFNFGRLTVTTNGIDTNDRIVLAGQGTQAGQVGVSGSNVTYGGVVVGSLKGSDFTKLLQITFNSNATQAAVTAVLKRVAFHVVGDAPQTANRTLSFRVTDGTGKVSETLVSNVTVVAVNDKPVLTGVPASIAYVANTAAKAVVPNAVLTDPDLLPFTNGRLTVTTATGGTALDVLSIAHQGTAAGQIGVSGLNVSYGGVAIGSLTGSDFKTKLTLTFNSNASPAAVQAVLRQLRFAVTGANAAAGTRSINLQLGDGAGGLSDLRTVNVAVTK